MEKLKKKLRFQVHYAANQLFPKQDAVLLCEPWNIEANNIEVANYLAEHYQMRVAYGLPKKLIPYAKKVLNPKVIVVDQNSFYFKYLYFTSKYIFAAHWKFPRFYTKDQVVLNIWHGVGHKKIGLMRGSSGIFAHFTLATSEVTQIAFAKSFGVPVESVVVAGYPRNDMMLKARTKRDEIKAKLEGNLTGYDKIIIWLPTFRTDTANNIVNGSPVENPFQVDGFDTEQFNKFLVEHNILCIVKPHPLDYHRAQSVTYSNVKVINDEWILGQGITLYHLTACTDIMVSDVSSIIVDYMLLDQPVICFSADFDEYKTSRGFYFDDIENWLPSKLVRNQSEFTEYLRQIVETGQDPWEQRRKELKKAFFDHQDTGSTARLLEHVFSHSK